MKTLLILAFLSIPSICLAGERPNIVFMLADDQGWSGLSVAMHPDVAGSKGDVFHTPNLERLAAQGMRFSAGYAPASVCSPTRISLQTGKSPATLHWTKAAPPESGHKLIEPRNVKSISANETTIGELLQKAGYATAHYGKWHINGGGPEKHGYDESDGDTGNENAFKFHDPNPVDIFGMAERAAAFMEKNSKAKKPFFIQLSWNALHASENANRATLAKYEERMKGENSKRIATAAITEDLDAGAGKVMEAIERLGLTGNTYVIYMSDNGSGGGKKVLAGGKGGVWEGGIRVPFIVRGPGVKANSWCHTRVVGYDLFPTFCEWAGINKTSLPKGLEGGSIASLLANDGRGEVKRSRDELVFHFPHYQGDAPHSAIFLGDLKLLHFYEDSHDELFDISQDIGERNDLAKQRPADTKKLRDRLEKYLASVDAQFPTPNPNFDPSKPDAPTKGNGDNGKKPKK
ncbi:MAG: sulfatase [Planctomycetia bacterium]|nr:sulfatase [Planctomycetia bacterium]